MSEQRRQQESGHAVAGEAIAGFVGSPHGGRFMRIGYDPITGQFAVRCGIARSGSSPAKAGKSTSLSSAVLDAVQNFNDWVVS